MWDSEQATVRNRLPVSSFPALARIPASAAVPQHTDYNYYDRLERTCHRRGFCIECLQSVPCSAGMRMALRVTRRAGRLLDAGLAGVLTTMGDLETRRLLRWLLCRD